MTGTLASCAAFSAGSSPSELSGEMINALAPCAIIPWMSAISLLRSDCALVVMSLMPRLAASSLMDCVSVIRNGFASFSDWAKPTVIAVRSSFGTPPLYLSWVQVRLASPARTAALTHRPCPGCWRAWHKPCLVPAPAPRGIRPFGGAVLSSLTLISAG